MAYYQFWSWWAFLYCEIPTVESHGGDWWHFTHYLTPTPTPRSPPTHPTLSLLCGALKWPTLFWSQRKNPYSKDLARRFRLALMIVEPISDWSRLMSHPVNGVIWVYGRMAIHAPHFYGYGFMVTVIWETRLGFHSIHIAGTIWNYNCPKWKGKFPWKITPKD